MDNRFVDVVSEGKEALRAVLALFDPPDGCVGYEIVPGKQRSKEEQKKPFSQWDTNRWGSGPHCDRMILFWSDFDAGEGFVKLPYKMNMDQITEFVWGWLSNVSYGRQPDHDGSNGKGWRVFCEDWGRVRNHHSAFACIEPAWAMYGK